MFSTLLAPSVRVERSYRAPPERVFDAWLDPGLVTNWMAPGSITARAEIDARIGGHYRVFHAIDGTSVGGFDARITDLDRPRHLAFDWGFWGPERDQGPRYDSRLTLTFALIPAGTRLVLVHDKLDALAAAQPEAAGSVEFGWQDVFNKLAMVIE